MPTRLRGMRNSLRVRRATRLSRRLDSIESTLLELDYELETEEYERAEAERDRVLRRLEAALNR